MKGLEFMGTSLLELRALPVQARRAAGYELDKIQAGKQPNDWKPMNAIGPGVCEIRIHHEGEWRVLYVAAFPEAVYVLHVFRKKTPKTSLLDVRLGKQRYQSLMLARRQA